MRASLYIERRVEKLAASRTPEVLIGIAENLLNPKPRFERVKIDDCLKWPEDKHNKNKLLPIYVNKHTGMWSCTCTYCQLHIVYTYLHIEMSKSARGCTTRSLRSADAIYYDLNRIKVIKHNLEILPMENMLVEHIKDAKKYIGSNFDLLRPHALDMRGMGFEELIYKAKNLIASYDGWENNHSIGKLGHKDKLSWF